jgi:hypothetical protein
MELAIAFESMEEQGWEGASYANRRLVSGHIRTLFHNWSNAYYQFRNGTLELEQWKAYEREARSAMANPRIRQVWSDWNQVYDDPFRELMNDVMADSNASTNQLLD